MVTSSVTVHCDPEPDIGPVTTVSRNVAELPVIFTIELRFVGSCMVAEPLKTDQVLDIT